MFKKKTLTSNTPDSIAMESNVNTETVIVHANPHNDPVCAGCSKPINTVQVTEDGNNFHNQYCLNDYHNIK